MVALFSGHEKRHICSRRSRRPRRPLPCGRGRRMKSLRVDGRLSFIVLVLSQLAATMGFTFVLPFTPIYVKALGVEDAGTAAAWAGVINSSTAVTMALAAPLWGRLGDRV